MNEYEEKNTENLIVCKYYGTLFSVLFTYVLYPPLEKAGYGPVYYVFVNQYQLFNGMLVIHTYIIYSACIHYVISFQIPFHSFKHFLFLLSPLRKSSSTPTHDPTTAAHTAQDPPAVSASSKDPPALAASSKDPPAVAASLKENPAVAIPHINVSPNTGIILDPATFDNREITDDEKLKLLSTKIWLPDKSYTYPATKGRRFNPKWVDDRQWIRYSVKNDSVYCISCFCFDTNRTSSFSTGGFKTWNKVLGKDCYLYQHYHSTSHQSCSEKAVGFLYTRQNAAVDISSQLQQKVAAEQIRAEKGLLSIIDIIISLGQRGIPLRGNWNSETNREDGNFDFFLTWKSKFDSTLRDHLEKSALNAKFTSPEIQNEIITICEDTIRANVVNDIPKYWSVMGDETQDCSDKEQLSICIRYVGDDSKVNEDFLGFVQLNKMDAKSISDALISNLSAWGLDLSNLVAQGYDGASVMSSGKAGVQAKIKEVCPKATYVHCGSHVLSLAISSSCKSVPSIRNLYDSISKLTWFLGASAKRKEIFKNSALLKLDDELLELLTATENAGELQEFMCAIQRGSKKQFVPKFCATRWSARLETVSALLAKYATVLDALDKIVKESTGDSKTDASAFIRLLEDPQFIVALVVSQGVLSYLGSVTKLLQEKACDLGEAYENVKLAKSCIENSRNNEQYWNKLWSSIEAIGKTIDVEIKSPRLAGRQQHRANASSGDDQSASDYYRLNVFYPFADHAVNQLDDRFTDRHEQLIAAQCLIPTKLAQLNEKKIENILQYYATFLNPIELQDIPFEMERWKKRYEVFEARPSNGSDAILQCGEHFPIIKKILTIFMSTPVGSVSCERSFSALRRLKSWTRSTMTERRLNGLALLFVHRHSNRIPTPQQVLLSKSNWKNV